MMMPKEAITNGNICHGKMKSSAMVYSGKSNGNGRKLNSLSIPIPTQTNNIYRLSTNGSDSSNDSFSVPGTPNAGDISPTAEFSRSLSTSQSSTFNVYSSMSPRSTSFMFQYYSTPKGYYQHQVPLETLRHSAHYHTDENASTRLRHRTSIMRTTSECCPGSPPSQTPILSGIPQTLQNDVLEDPRRRAFSESDSHRKNHMHMSRMSALKKLKMRLARSGSLKKKKDYNGNTNDSRNHSVSSINSLEKVEEGRQLLHSKTASPCSSKRSTMNEDQLNCFNTLSLHEEDETTKLSQRIAEKNNNVARERLRSQSSDNPEADHIYQRFLEEHSCYDIMPTSCKLVVFDTRLQARKAFHALIENAVRSAPLWDSVTCCYVGVLTVTDFIKVILTAHRSADMEVEAVEEQTIECWRKVLEQKPSFTSVCPHDTLLHSLNTLTNEHFHGIPILDEESGDIFHIINHKRILRFLHLFMNELPMPWFMKKTLGEMRIGTYEDVVTVTKDHTMLDVLELIVSRKLTAIPVLDEQGEVRDVFSKLDMIPLAAQGLYHDLSMTLEIALACRSTPLFEDENCSADAFTRFSSPKPLRRDFANNNQHSDRGDSYSSGEDQLSAFLDKFSTRGDCTLGKKGPNMSLKGHNVIRPKRLQAPMHNNASSERNMQVNSSPAHLSRHQPAQLETLPSLEPCTHRRHKSLSNPLVKCRLSDPLQYVIDLMVGSDANLLVVVAQSSDHVVGVVTVSDVLAFLTNPPMGNSSPSSQHLSARKRRSRLRYSSISSASSLPSVQDGPEIDGGSFPEDNLLLLPAEMSSNGRVPNGGATLRISTPSDTSSRICMDQASYSWRKDANMNHQIESKQGNGHVNPRFLGTGEQMERA